MKYFTVVPLSNYRQRVNKTPNIPILHNSFINNNIPYYLMDNNISYNFNPHNSYNPIDTYSEPNFINNHKILNNNPFCYDINSYNNNFNNTMNNIKPINHNFFPIDNIQINQSNKLVNLPFATVKPINNHSYPTDSFNDKTTNYNQCSNSPLNNRRIINNPQPNIIKNNQNRIPNRNVSDNIIKKSEQKKTLNKVKNNTKIINEPKTQNQLNSPKTNNNNNNTKKIEDNKNITTPQNNTQEPDKQKVNQINNNVKTLPNNVKNQKQIIENHNNKIKKDIINNNNINEKQKIISGGVKKSNLNDINNYKNNVKIKNPNLATVTKISGDAPNTPAPSQNKPSLLTVDDLYNIIYLDVGIINLGNTCFINSCLQVLIHCTLFIYNFFEKRTSIKEKDTPISYNLLKACATMANTVYTKQKYIDITYLKNVFGSKHPQFEGYFQNDSQEFCRVLLEDINTELNEIKNKPIYKTLTNTDRKTKKVRDLEFDKNFSEREKSIITELFYAQIITTYTCECKLAIYSFQKLLDFPLLLPDNCPKTTINNLLKSYFQTEVIDFGKKCEKCGKILKHKKEIKISRPPKILILSLQRIDQATRKKNECFVSFPQVLDMSEFIDQELNIDKPKPIYTLFAVVNHIGNMDYGHYFSYIKFDKRQDWYEFNDSSVKNIGNKIESFPYAYALFYIKNENTKK